MAALVLDHPACADFSEIFADDGSLLFRFDRRAFQKLELLVRDGLNALPRTGLEVGGLVAGSMPGGDETVLTVADFVPVGIDYRLGPRFRPAEEEKPAFAEALKKFTSPDWQIVGCFRSHLGGTVGVREEDRQLLNSVLDGRDCCLILIHAAMFQPSVAYLYARRDHGELCLMHTFPVSEVASQEVMEVAALPEFPSPEDREVADARVPRVEQAHEPHWTEKAHGRPARWLAFAGGMCAAAAVFSLGRMSVPAPPAVEASVAKPPEPERVGLGLSIRSHGPKVELTWDAGSKPVRSAVGGSLEIKDGRNHDRRVDLSAAQVLAGFYEYVPAQSELTFELTLRQTDNSFVGQTQSFHAILPPPEPALASQKKNAAKARSKVRPPVKKPAVKAKGRT